MNIKYFLMTAAIVVATSSAAMAADAGKPMMGGKGKEMTFEERKAKTLEHMGKRIAAMQKKQACVQAAATQEAMKACFPNMGKRGENMKKGMKDKQQKMQENKGDAAGSGQ
ncbi:MAG: hypothetical protein K8R48_10500 [Alphaproteobacteria bacterium]|nr:hypothetical protein [Alphaproteobacteria bacterium]